MLPAPAASPSGPPSVALVPAAGRSRRVVVAGGLVALFACLALFAVIAQGIHGQGANALDALATPLLGGQSNPTLDAVMRTVTNLGSTVVVAPLFVVALALLLWRRHPREASLVAVATAGSVVINQSLKVIFHRPRPSLAWAEVQAEWSFPSGHAMNSLVFYGALALVAWALWGRRAGVISIVAAISLALLIGTSRVYLGYHYVTDVAGGFLAGAAWLGSIAALLMLGGRRRLGLRREVGSDPAPSLTGELRPGTRAVATVAGVPGRDALPAPADGGSIEAGARVRAAADIDEPAGDGRGPAGHPPCPS
jgi:undecaprenyl-diphosphatase